MMVIKQKKLRWRVVRALFVGVGISILIPELLAAFLLPGSWVGYTDLPQETRAPTYLDDIAPAFTNAYKNFPADSSGSDPLFGGINLGVDMVNYNYGVGYFDPNFVPWDPTTSDTPDFVDITRFRFGYPWRALTWDDLSTGTNVYAPAVGAFHEKMYDRAGIYRGIGVSFLGPGLRLPIAPIWTGLILNVFFWSAVWFFPNELRRWVRTYRRKHRGLCLVCGYEVEDLGICPECGVERVQDCG